MKVDVMRKIDFFIGVPICFIGTIIRRFTTLFTPGHKASRPERIVLIELSEMGSTILADPAMNKLKNDLKAELFFVIFKKNQPSLELLGTVPRDNIYTIDESSFLKLAADSLGFLFWTRRNRIDTVIDMELFSRFSALLTGFAGAQRTVGFHAFHNEGLYRGGFLTHKVAYNPHQHMAKNFIALANAVMGPEDEVPFSKTVISNEEMSLRKITVSDAAKDSMRSRIKEACPVYAAGRHRLVLFNANASELLPIRRWPRGNYVTVARAIMEKYPDVVILLTGGKDDQAWLEQIRIEVRNERCINFAGRTTLRELPALYSVSAFMLSNDSGPPHFASVTDMPLFVFFGPETPALYCPLGNATPIYAYLACSPCVSASNHRKTACTNNICLQIITPDQVLKILRPALETVQ